ncbi:MAG: 4-(cytidine 5'-diphospho)-2-C-methyl-D-erythritol kinase [Firmicutes bacterium]|nr:4-(cytidine 5'-diphospho)-2-C-methyl-D-erythritol kinase [Bacillota bacterium]
MKSVIIKAPCKINLGLNILGLENGYHLLDTVMVAVSLCDTIEMRLRNDGEVRVSFDGATGIDPIKNSAYQAAEYVRDKFRVTQGADIKVTKRVPVAAGLGGSSCDAAGVLRAYEILLGLPITIEDAAKLGSDTAFLWAAMGKKKKGGFAARCTGRGEVLEPFEIKPIDLVIAVSGKVNTAECYRKFDEMYPSYKDSPSDVEALTRALGKGDVGAIAKSLGNALQNPAMELEPKVSTTMELVKGTSPIALLMSGSGASVVGLYKDKKSADSARVMLKDKADFVW